MFKRTFWGLSICLIAAGCGGVATVKGTVSYKGDLLKSGSVTAEASNGTHQAAIQPDGTFEMKGVATGKVNFLVYCENPKFTEALVEATTKSKEALASDKPAGKDGGRIPGGLNIGGGSKLGNPNMIPDKYMDSTKKLLMFDVVGGENKFDIKLVP